MQDIINFGLSVALQPINILFCFLGVLIGTLIGVLPGLGPAATISLLLPSTFHMSPVSAIIMLAGIYYGAQYGGSTTSILVNVPGEAASVVTCLDGYQMARNGRAGPALAISAFGSFIGGTLSIVGLMLLAPLLAKIALRFGPPELFSLMVLGLVVLSYLASGSVIKAMIMAAFGIFLGNIGVDIITGKPKFNLGIITLMDGIGLIPVVMGLFGIGEVLFNIEKSEGEREILQKKISNFFPNLKDWMESIGAIIRGTVIGFFLGILPGGGAAVSSFASYAIEKKVSRHPEKFGGGAIAGVAGPETANNSATGGAFIPLLTLGIPSNVVMALLLGALLINGIQPGPLLIKEHPDLFWGVVVSMYLGNLMLLILNLPLIPLWVQILKIPYRILFPLILLFCVIGVYSLNDNVVEIFIMIFFGALGYLMRKLDFEPAPLVLALVLSPMLENSLRSSLLMSQGSFLIFFLRPISSVLLLLAIFLLTLSVIPRFRKPIRE